MNCNRTRPRSAGVSPALSLAVYLLAMILASACAPQVSLGQAATSAGRSPPEYLASLPAEKLAELQINRETFAKLRTEEQQRLRQLHQELTAAPDRAELTELMTRYNEWLKKLPSRERADLLSKPTNDRIAEIKRIVEQQTANRFRESMERVLKEDDYRAIRDWFHDLVGRREAKIVELLSPYDKEQLKKIDSPEWRRNRIMAMLAFGEQFRGTGVAGTVLKPADEDIARLSQQLSSAARKLLDEAGGADEKGRLIQTWFASAVKARFAPSKEQLERFVRDELNDSERAYLDNLPPDRKRTELELMYGRHRARGFPYGRPGGRPPGGARPDGFGPEGFRRGGPFPGPGPFPGGGKSFGRGDGPGAAPQPPSPGSDVASPPVKVD